MQKKAEAWKLYQDAAMVDMVLDTLPKVTSISFHKPIFQNPFRNLF